MNPPKRFCPFCSGRLSEKAWEGRQRLFCDRCQTAVYENPTPVSCLVVVNPATEIVLVKRSVDPQKGMWCLPGGFMELGETPEECALRELSEETGLVGRIDTLLGVCSTPSPFYHTILMVGYLVLEFEGKARAGDDASAVAPFEVKKMPPLAFSSHDHFIRLACRRLGLSFPGQKT